LALAIANALGPVFLVIALGWLLCRQGFLSATALHDITRLTYWVGLPCWLFYKIAGASLSPGDAGDLLLVTAGATVAGIIVSYGLAKGLGLPHHSIGTFIQAAFRGNLAFVGLPVIYYAFAGQGDSAPTSALLIFGPMVVLYNTAAVLALLLTRQRLDGRLIGQTFKELLINPLLLACLAGGLYALSGLALPVVLERSCAAVGQMALPLALLCIGGTLATVRLQGEVVGAVGAAVAKVVLLPLLGYAFARTLGLKAESTRIALIFLACPTATVSYVVVQQLGGNRALASSAIALSTVLAVVSLAAILAVT